MVEQAKEVAKAVQALETAISLTYSELTMHFTG